LWLLRDRRGRRADRQDRCAQCRDIFAYITKVREWLNGRASNCEDRIVVGEEVAGVLIKRDKIDTKRASKVVGMELRRLMLA
jgi:hypothetical protein